MLKKYVELQSKVNGIKIRTDEGGDIFGFKTSSENNEKVKNHMKNKEKNMILVAEEIDNTPGRGITTLYYEPKIPRKSVLFLIILLFAVLIGFGFYVFNFIL